MDSDDSPIFFSLLPRELNEPFPYLAIFILVYSCDHLLDFLQCDLTYKVLKDEPENIPLLILFPFSVQPLYILFLRTCH